MVRVYGIDNENNCDREVQLKCDLPLHKSFNFGQNLESRCVKKELKVCMTMIDNIYALGFSRNHSTCTA